MRNFQVVKEESKKFVNRETMLPKRSDYHSAGYDFYSKENFTLLPNSYHVFWTDVKAEMQNDEVLQIYTRSGNGTKKGLILRNNVGIIDASYYGNDSNDGNIGICLFNSGTDPVEVNEGDRIAQGIFYKYLITDEDHFYQSSEASTRTGGFGSTGK